MQQFNESSIASSKSNDWFIYDEQHWLLMG